MLAAYNRCAQCGEPDSGPFVCNRVYRKSSTRRQAEPNGAVRLGSLVILRQTWPELAWVEDEHEASWSCLLNGSWPSAFHRPRFDAGGRAQPDADSYTVPSMLILHICDALHRARPDAEITLWVHSDSAQLYGSEQRYPKWRIVTAYPWSGTRRHWRLSQPWYHSDLNLLGRLAAVEHLLDAGYHRLGCDLLRSTRYWTRCGSGWPLKPMPSSSSSVLAGSL